MGQRINYSKTAPEGIEILHSLEKYIQRSGLESTLLELVRIKVSQINHCAYCIDMHTKDARSRGESEQRLYGLSAWQESPFYSERERGALAWAEAVTQLNESPVADELFEQSRKLFSEKELTDLTLAVIAINSWNRLAISFRSVPGSYQPDHPVAMKRTQINVEKVG